MSQYFILGCNNETKSQKDLRTPSDTKSVWKVSLIIHPGG